MVFILGAPLLCAPSWRNLASGALLLLAALWTEIENTSSAGFVSTITYVTALLAAYLVGGTILVVGHILGSAMRRSPAT